MDGVIAEPEGSHEPTEFVKTPRKAVASGWIGSALEYYDFFIYATAASLVFPDVFFPKGNDKVALIGSLATYGVGYVARPVGAFFLGNWGDRFGRKNVLVLCMLMMGASTLLVAFLPSYATAGLWAPALLLVLRLTQGFAVGGELSGASAMIVENSPFGRRGYFGSFTLQGTQGGQLIAAAVFLPLYFGLSSDNMDRWGWRIPFALSAVVVAVGYFIRRNVDETPAFREEAVHGEVPRAPIVQAVVQSWPNMSRVVVMALMNCVAVLATTFAAAFATNAGYGVGMDTKLYLFIPVIANAIAMFLIPYVGNLSDRFGRRRPIIIGALGAGILAYPYLYFIMKDNVPLTIVFAVLMWGCVYQGYNAVFPAFYQEMFPTRTRVTAFAVSQNIGTLITAFLPTIYAAIAGPAPDACVSDKKFLPTKVVNGQTCSTLASQAQHHVLWTVGSITFGLTVLAAISAFSSRETFMIHLNDCGEKDARPVSEEAYAQARQAAVGVF
jgi:MFS family permease